MLLALDAYTNKMYNIINYYKFKIIIKKMYNSSYSIYKCSGSGDSVPKTGSMNCDPLPLKVIFAPVSPLMYNRFAPPAPIILPLKSNPSGAFSIPTQIFSYKNNCVNDNKRHIYAHS